MGLVLYVSFTFFDKRFDDNKGLLKRVSGVTILVFFTFYASSGMVGVAILFEQVFGLIRREIFRVVGV